MLLCPAGRLFLSNDKDDAEREKWDRKLNDVCVHRCLGPSPRPAAPVAAAAAHGTRHRSFDGPPLL
jgi:hypothetical protein